MKPLLTIVCITYNHEKFIRQTLDSFVMQKTNFKFEILIHDDASTDGTAEIIKEYQGKYPDIIKPILQIENQYSKNVPVLKTFVYPLIKTKYVALCEGDDYWTDDTKLQKQVDFLEANPDYSICFHPVKVIFEDKKQGSYIFPFKGMIKEGLTFENLLKRNFIQTNSVVYRWRFHQENAKEFIPNGILPGDWHLHLLHAKVGKIAMLKEIMAVYRKHSGGIWYDTDPLNRNLHCKHGFKELNFYKDVYENIVNSSEEYLIEVYLPMFRQIADAYYSCGQVENLQKMKEIYPDLFEKVFKIKKEVSNNIESKYKKLFNIFLPISIILFLTCTILILALLS